MKKARFEKDKPYGTYVDVEIPEMYVTPQKGRPVTRAPVSGPRHKGRTAEEEVRATQQQMGAHVGYGLAGVKSRLRRKPPRRKRPKKKVRAVAPKKKKAAPKKVKQASTGHQQDAFMT